MLSLRITGLFFVILFGLISFVFLFSLFINMAETVYVLTILQMLCIYPVVLFGLCDAGEWMKR